MRDQLLNLFANGTPVEEACAITGVNTDIIGEFLKDKTFVADLRERKNLLRQENIEQSYAKLEESTLRDLKKEVDAGVLDVKDKVRILEVVSKNRVLYRNPAQSLNHPGVHLHVTVRYPQQAEAAALTIDQKTNQIVAIGDRSMAAMPIGAVKRLFTEMEKEATITDIDDLSDDYNANPTNETSDRQRVA